MRHFSGEFEGVRLLMADELDLIAGGEGEDTDDVPEDPWDSCNDRKTDNRAQQLANAMAGMGGISNTEYGAVIYRGNDGQLHTSNILTGDHDSVDGMQSLQQLGLTSWSQVVGVIHSHPTTYIDANGNSQPVGPNAHWDKPSGSDHAYMDFIANQGVSVNNLRQYIYHNGSVSEYIYNQNNNTSLSGDDRWMSSVKSNNYDPNAQCPG